MRQGQLDDVSKRIIEQLQENGRRSYAEIGKAVGLGEAAVRQRVQRLTESGVVQIVAVTDPIQVGFHRQAMVGLHVTGDSRAVAAELEKDPFIDYVVLTAKEASTSSSRSCASRMPTSLRPAQQPGAYPPRRRLDGDVRLPGAPGSRRTTGGTR